MEYKSPKLTVDGILIVDNELLLIKRGNQPFKGDWALPGGFVEYGETTEDAVVREYREETGLNVEIKSLFGVYSDPNRDPRGHTVSVVYKLSKKNGKLKSGDDASDACFFPISDLPTLAFDHKIIINDMIRRKKR